MLLSYRDKQPVVSPGAFVAPTATIIGDVEIADGASIWYGAILRGDFAPIRIGANTNIQDNCTVHTDIYKPAFIGASVTVGHNAVVHGCTIEDRCLIGINAVVLSGAHIQTGTIVGAGAMIREGQVVGPYQLMTGIPASLKKTYGEDVLQVIDAATNEYLQLARDHQKSLGS